MKPAPGIGPKDAVYCSSTQGLVFSRLERLTGRWDMRQLNSEDWPPGPFGDIAIIGKSMKALSSDQGFTPERIVEDGLGWICYVSLELDNGTHVFLSWPEGGNPEQVQLQADITDRPYTTTVDNVLSALGLEGSVVLWRCDEDGYAEVLEWLTKEGRLK